MKRFIKRMVLFLCAMLLIGALAATASAATVDSGKCGDNVKWVLDDAGTLTISGTGTMYDYDNYDSGEDTPWMEHRNSVKKVVIKSGVTSIGRCAFDGCRNMTSIEIPDSVKSMGEFAFAYCSGLTSVRLPDGMEKISYGLFQLCDNLQSIKIPDSVTSIEGCGFYCCRSLTSIDIPDSVTVIGECAFYFCKNLKSVRLPGNLTKIEWYLFEDCESLTDITIPESVTYIELGAFYGCSSLKSITIPKNVNTIMDSAFDKCTALTSIVFKGDAPTFGYGVFRNVTATAYYPAGNKTWNSENMQNYDGNITWKSYAPIEAPTLKASNVASTGKIKLTWDAVSGAAKYELYRATSKNGTYTKLTTVTGTSATNTKTDAGKTYYYKIRAIDADGNKSDWSNIVSRMCDLPQPKLTASNVASTGKIKLSWNAVEGAAKYQILRSLDNENWEHLTYTTNTSATNTKVDAGKIYYYKIRAIHSDSAATSAYSSVVSRTCDLPQPKVTASNVTSTGKIKLSWNKVEGAVKYQILRSLDNKNWEHLAYTTNTSATNTKTDAGKTYYYKVRAIHSSSAANSAYSAIVSRTCDLAQPTLTVKLNSNGKPTLSWTKVTGAVKYQIMRSTDNKNWEHLAYSTGTSATNTKAVAGIKYYYKIRAIHSNTDANSAYSAVKYITAK